MALNLGSIFATLDLTDNFTPTLARVDQHLHRSFGSFLQFQAQTTSLGLGIQQFGSHLARTGDQLSIFSAALVGVGGASVKAAAEFETSMVRIGNLTDIGVQGIGRMRDAVLDLAPAVGKGPQELVEALYAIGSVGIKGAEAIDILTVSAKASAVGLGEVKDVSRAVSAAVINYGEENLSAAKATDQLLVAVKEGGAEADAFAKTLGRVIAPAKLLNISFAEVLASVSTFTRLGVRADEAVTALRGTMATLLKPSAGAEKQLLSLGLSMDAVRKSVKEIGLAPTLIELVKLANESKEGAEAIAAIVPNVRALAGVLANAQSQSSAYLDITKKITNASGDLNKAFETVSETAGQKFKNALAQLKVIGIELGDALLPAVVSLVQAMKPLMEMVSHLIAAFDYLPGPVKFVTAAFLGLSLALGPILSIGGRLIETFGLLSRLFTGLKSLMLGNAVAMDIFAASAAKAAVAGAAASATTGAATGLTAIGTGATLGLNAIQLAQTRTEVGRFTVEIDKAAKALGTTRTEAGLFSIAIGQSAADVARAASENNRAIATMTGGTEAMVVAEQKAYQALRDVEGAAILLGRQTVPLLTRAFGLLTGTLGGLVGLVAGVFASMVAGAALLTGKWDDLMRVVGKTPEAFGDVFSIIKNFNILIGQTLVTALEMAGAAIVRFRDTARAAMPSLFEEISRQLDKFLAGWELAFAIIDRIDKRLKEMTRVPVTTQSILEEAEARRASALGAGATKGKSTEQINQEARELYELLLVYHNLTRTVDQYGQQTKLSGEAVQILVERFKKLKEAGLQLPKEIDIFIKVNSIPINANAEEMTWQQWGQLVNDQAAKVGLAAKKLETDTDQIRQFVAKVNAEIAKLTPKQRTDIQFGISQPGGLTKDMKDNIGALFSSAEVAEAAIRKLGDTTRQQNATMAREKSWIENFRLSAVQLEAQLGEAYKQVDAGAIKSSAVMEQFGNQIETVGRKSGAFNKEIGVNTARAMADFIAFQAEEPFRNMQERADVLDAVIGRARANGRSMKEIYDIWGQAAVDVAEKNSAMAGTVGTNLRDLQNFAEDFKLEEVLKGFDRELEEFQRRIGRTASTAAEQAQLNQMAQDWVDAAEARVVAAEAAGVKGKELIAIMREETRVLQDNEKAFLDNSKAIKQIERNIEDLNRAFKLDTLATALEDVTIKFNRQREDIKILALIDLPKYNERMQLLAKEEVAARNVVIEAWRRQGAFTRAELNILAVEATRKYQVIRDTGVFAAEEIEKRWRAMVEATVKALDPLRGSLVKLVGDLPDIVSQAFGKMMRTAQTFKEFFVGIWEAIRDAVYNVFQEIVERFIRRFLQGILDGMLNSKKGIAETVGAVIGDGMEEGINEAIAKSGGGIMKKLSGFFKNIFKDLGGGIASGGPTSMATVVGGGLIAAVGATVWKKASDSKFQNTMGGMMTGAGIGTMIMPGIGTVVGAGVGAFIGYLSSFFRKPEFKKIMGDVGREWGVSITEGLAKEIEETAKKIEGGTKKQRRELAEALSLSKIIEEGGGLTEDNLVRFELGATRLFKPIEEGSKQAGAATKELNSLIGQFAAQAEKTGGLWDIGFKAIIGRAQELGLEMENLTAIINAQFEKLAGGLKKMTSGLTSQVKKAFIEEFKTGLGDLPGLGPQAEKIFEALGDPEALKAALKDFDEALKKSKDELGGEWLKKFGIEMEVAADAADGAGGNIGDLQRKLRDANLDFREAQNDVARYSEKLADMIRKGKSSAAEIENVRLQVERAQFRMDTASAAIARFTDELAKIGQGPGDVEAATRIIKVLPEEMRKQLEGMGLNLDQLLEKLREKFQPTFDRLSRIAFASFNTIIANGRSAVEAIDTIGESVDELILLHDKLGLKGSAAYDALARFRNLTKDNADLVGYASGINDVITALSNLGGLTPDIFADLQVELKDTFDKLTAAGFTTNEALTIMKPALENIIRLHKEQGLAIDENTQKLIDLGIEQGILDGNMMTTNQILMSGFAAIIIALKGELPEAFKEFANKSVNQVRRVNTELDNLEKPRIAVIRGKYEPPDNMPPGDEPPAEEPPEGPRAPEFATGGAFTAAGQVIHFKPRGTDTLPAMISPGENIITSDDTRMLMDMLRGRAGGSAIDYEAMATAIVAAFNATHEGNPLQLVVNTPIGLADTIRQVVLEEVIPVWLAALEDNRSGLRTRTQQALGI